MLLWLPRVLREAGLNVIEVKGWQRRGMRDLSVVKGIVAHHTASARGKNMPSLDVVTRGRSDLRGPLSQLVLGRDGTYAVVAAGTANHAGRGAWPFYKAGIPPGSANKWTIGIEAENMGTGKEPWPEVQLDAYKRGVAAICKHLGLDPAYAVVGHKEYAPSRKPDPVLIDMGQFRKDVALLMKEEGGSDARVALGPSSETLPSNSDV
jgi:hypothetical protein